MQTHKWHDEERQSVAEMGLTAFTWLWPSALMHTVEGGRIAALGLTVSEGSTHSCSFLWTSWEHRVDRTKSEAGP